MTTDNMKQTIKKLSQQVGDLTNKLPIEEIEINNGLDSGKSMNNIFVNNFKNKNFVIYTILPLMVGIVLYVWKPEFCLEEKVDMNTGEVTKNISYNKLVVFSVVVGGALVAGCVGYLHGRK
jgi:hypothetical protein